MFDDRPAIAAVLASMLGLLSPANALAVQQHYTVAFDEGLEYLDVKACFKGMLPRRLTAGNEDAADLLREVRINHGDASVAITPRDSAIALPRVAEPACVHYRADLGALDGLQWRSGNWRTHDAIVLDPGLWLWLPEDRHFAEGWRLDFELPDDFDVSAPWRRSGREGHRVTYEMRERMPEREGRVAIGRFSVESIDYAGGRVRYALLPGDPAPDASAMRRWVTRNIHALATAYGSLPVADLQLLVVPVGHGDEPVPWGEVQRAGGDAVHVYINQRFPEAAFMDDWVLVHELSHLLHPVIVSGDRWLSEGIASYYQNVLRARAGLMSAETAWNKLHAGFERGIRGTAPGRSLAEVSETMMRDRSFMRVYWSGAAVALLADVELRRRSAGAHSLDTALAAFRDCCLPAGRSWTAREFMQELDRLTGTNVFVDLYRQHVDSDEFPGLTALYAELGLARMSSTRLRLDPTAAGAGICAAIMAAPQG